MKKFISRSPSVDSRFLPIGDQLRIKTRRDSYVFRTGKQGEVHDSRKGGGSMPRSVAGKSILGADQSPTKSTPPPPLDRSVKGLSTFASGFQGCDVVMRRKFGWLAGYPNACLSDFSGARDCLIDRECVVCVWQLAPPRSMGIPMTISLVSLPACRNPCIRTDAALGLEPLGSITANQRPSHEKGKGF